MAALDHRDEKGSGRNLEVHFELPEDDDHFISRRKQSRSSLESVVLENNENGIDTFESKHVRNERPTSTYSIDFAYPSPVWSFQSASVTQCPPNQMMARPGYDPKRIPLSIFSSKPTNPLGWSHTSNESLFSLQAGNNSFSRDHFFPGNKCVESPWPDESIIKSMALHPVEEVVPSNYADIGMHSDSVLTTDTSEETADLVMVTHCESIEALAESAKVVLRETAEDNSKDATAPSEGAKNITSVVSYRSEDSLMSVQSFQLPVLAVEGGRNSSITTKSENQELEKPLRPPSPRVETAPNIPGPRNRWYYFSCCSRCC